MPKLYQYQKVIDEYTTHATQGDGVIELCEIDGITYVAVPDWITLPNEQPEQITVKEIVPDAALKEKIKKASPHIHLVNQRVVEKIRQKIDVNDELKLMNKLLKFIITKVTPDAESLAEFNAYVNHVEACRNWGKDEKAKLGMG